MRIATRLNKRSRVQNRIRPAKRRTHRQALWISLAQSSMVARGKSELRCFTGQFHSPPSEHHVTDVGKPAASGSQAVNSKPLDQVWYQNLVLFWTGKRLLLALAACASLGYQGGQLPGFWPYTVSFFDPLPATMRSLSRQNASSSRDWQVVMLSDFNLLCQLAMVYSGFR